MHDVEMDRREEAEDNAAWTEDDAVFRAKVWPSGMYEGMSKPEFVPFAASAVHSLLQSAAYSASHGAHPKWLVEGLAKLRDDALVLAQRVSPCGMIPEPVGELGARIQEARALHEKDEANHA